MCGWECREGKGQGVDGSVDKGKSNVWMIVWRREMAMSGWECSEGKGRCVDERGEKGKGDEWLGV